MDFLHLLLNKKITLFHFLEKSRGTKVFPVIKLLSQRDMHCYHTFSTCKDTNEVKNNYEHSSLKMSMTIHLAHGLYVMDYAPDRGMMICVY